MNLVSNALLVERFCLDRKIGEGRSGEVWVAHDNRLDIDVACKVLRPDIAENKESLFLLRQETGLVRRLHHPNIIVLDDLYMQDHRPIVVMEWVDGRSLSELVRGEGGNLDPEQALHYARQIAKALDHAHHQGVMHRDLKLSDVLVTAAGTAKVTDFGVAHRARWIRAQRRGQLAGPALLYMSPEQIRGKGVDHRTDIYSLAMLTYHLLAGHAPFGDSTDIIHSQLSDNIESLPNVPDCVNNALAIATAKRKEARPDSAAAFVRMLEGEETDGAGNGVRKRSEIVASPGEVRLFAEMPFVWIPPGEFDMGSREGFRNERPPHAVTLSKGFWIGQYPITKEEWTAVTGQQPWKGKRYVCDDPRSPAVCISWKDVQVFLKLLNRRGEGHFRLPTEAEWEYACRAGSTTTYCFGDDPAELGDYGWHYGIVEPLCEDYAHPVGLKKPNPWNIYEMHGNVWEWCQDVYGQYSGGAVTDPEGAWRGDNRVLRGGSWNNAAPYCRSANRYGYAPDFRSNGVGVRICVEPN